MAKPKQTIEIIQISDGTWYCGWCGKEVEGMTLLDHGNQHFKALGELRELAKTTMTMENTK